MKQALLLLTMILPISQAFGQDLDEQAARKRAEYAYTYSTALNAAPCTAGLLSSWTSR